MTTNRTTYTDNLVGLDEEFADLALTPEQRAAALRLRQQRLLIAQLRVLAVNVDQAVNLVENGVLDTTDGGYHTILRLLQVFSYVITSNSNDDSIAGADSAYEQLLHADPAMPGILAGGGLLSATIGSALILREIRNQRQRNTAAYQLASVKEANPQSLVHAKHELTAQYQLFLKKRKVTTQAADMPELVSHHAPKPSKLAAFFAKLEKNRLFQLFTNALDKAKTASLFFWPVWFTGVLLTSLAAVSLFPFAPIIIGISLALGIGYMATISIIRYRKSKAADAKEVQAANVEAKELTRVRDDLKQHLHIKESHRYFNFLFLGKSVNREIGKNAPACDPAYDVKTTGKDDVIYLEPNTLPNETPVAKTDYSTEKQHAVLNSGIYQHLTNAKRQKHLRGISTALDAVGKYTLTAFVFWLVCATLGALVVAFGWPLLPVIAVLGSGITGTVIGVIAGGFSGMREFFKMKKADTAANAQVEATLAATYLGKIAGTRDHDFTKAQAFDHFENELNAGKAKIKDALLAKQTELKARVKAKQPLTDKEKYLLTLDLKKIDVYNDHYFKMQKVKVSWRTRLKQMSSDLFKVTSAAQTGIFVVRTLLLVGGVVAMAVTVPPVAFIVVAVVAAVAMVALRSAHVHFNKKAQDAANMAKNIDSRIYYMEKQCKELAVLDKELNGHTSEHAAPAEAILVDAPAPAPQVGTTNAPATDLMDKPVAKAILAMQPKPVSVFHFSNLFSRHKLGNPSACAAEMNQEIVRSPSSQAV